VRSFALAALRQVPAPFLLNKSVSIRVIRGFKSKSNGFKPKKWQHPAANNYQAMAANITGKVFYNIFR